MPIVRQTPQFLTLSPDGQAHARHGDGWLAYEVAIFVNAPPAKVMKTLTDAARFTQWNSTLVSLSGSITLGGTVKLVSKLAPNRTFTLKVSELTAHSMVWEDGMPLGLFAGVRSFRATAELAGTVFAMSEVYSGRMLGMIAKSLPDMRASFEAYAADLKRDVERS